MRKALLAVLLAIIASSEIIQFAQAQNNTGSRQLCKRESQKRMDKEVVLPDIPRFPGAKFVSGQEAASKEQVVCAYTIEYSVPKRSEPQIIPWYFNELKSGGWMINQQTSHSVDASNEKTNAHCNIFYDTGDAKNSTLHVNYVITPKQSYSGSL